MYFRDVQLHGAPRRRHGALQSGRVLVLSGTSCWSDSASLARLALSFCNICVWPSVLLGPSVDFLEPSGYCWCLCGPRRQPWIHCAVTRLSPGSYYWLKYCRRRVCAVVLMLFWC